MVLLLPFLLNNRCVYGPFFIFQFAPIGFDLRSLERQPIHTEARTIVLQHGGILCEIENFLGEHILIDLVFLA